MIEIYIEDYFYSPAFKELVASLFPKYQINYSSKDILDRDYICIKRLGNYFHLESSIDGNYIQDKINYKDINVYIERHAKQKDVAIKKLLVKNFKEDLSLPWGILTGIRPMKIVHKLMDKGLGYEIIRRVLLKEYLIDEGKVKLLLDIASRQRAILEESKGHYSLYFSIPFCPSICQYCSFPTLAIGSNEDRVGKYVETIIYEFKETLKFLDKSKINTVYIGGGTPTSIEARYLERIISEVKEAFKGIGIIREFTVEAGRPDTLNYNYLKLIKDSGVDRISINPQTMNDRTLKLIGRKHSSKEIIDIYKEAVGMGFKSINMDLIIGLPGESYEDMKKSFSSIRKLGPDNLTIHTLAIKKGSVFDKKYSHHSSIASCEIKTLQKAIEEMVESMDLKPYYLYRQKHSFANLENIGYAKEGQESIYNISMMEERETVLAFGMGAVSKILDKSGRINRQANFKGMDDYLNRVDELIYKKIKHLCNNG